LDENGKAIVRKLREWAGDLVKVAGNKWKCTPVLMPIENKSLTTLVKVPHMRKNLKQPRINPISQPPLLPLQRKKMPHWLSILKSLIGITKMAKTSQRPLSILT